jgi:hypothetical protein
MNPFTDESRDARLKMAVEGLCDTLRAPASLHRLVMQAKPAFMPVGDFALKAMLDSAIDALKVRGDYRGIQGLLGTLFGQTVPGGTADTDAVRKPPARVPDGTSGADRHPRRSA